MTCHFLSVFLIIGMGLADETPVVDLDSPARDELVSTLGADTWQEREKAREKLRLWGMENVRDLASLTHAQKPQRDEPEVRLQLAEVLKEVVIAKLYVEPAFLGIRMQQVYVPLIAEGKQYHPIEVAQVLEGCAAMDQGLKNGDRILQIDDRVCIRPSFTTIQFISYVAGKAPGDIVRLKIQSLEEGVVTKEVKLGARGDSSDPLIQDSKKDRQEAFYQKWIQTQGKPVVTPVPPSRAPAAP